MASVIQGCILTTRGFVDGTLEYVGGRVQRILGAPIADERAREEARTIILPGFIDTHVHGGGGRDTMEGGDAIDCIARLHVRHGTTSLLATTMTAPLPDVEFAMRALGGACRSRRNGAARVLGVHLEGPYINPRKLGAQPDFVRPASIPEVLALHALAPIALITLAPELPGNLDIIPALRAAGFRVQIGHTLGTYEDGVAALERAPAALRICSTRCRECTIARPVSSVRRSRTRSTRRSFRTWCTYIRGASSCAARDTGPVLRHRLDGGDRHAGW